MRDVVLELINEIQCGDYINSKGENLNNNEAFKQYKSYVASQLKEEE